MYRKRHSTYNVWYYPWFQASTEVSWKISPMGKEGLLFCLSPPLPFNGSNVKIISSFAGRPSTTSQKVQYALLWVYSGHSQGSWRHPSPPPTFSVFHSLIPQLGPSVSFLSRPGPLCWHSPHLTHHPCLHFSHKRLLPGFNPSGPCSLLWSCQTRHAK